MIYLFFFFFFFFSAFRTLSACFAMHTIHLFAAQRLDLKFNGLCGQLTFLMRCEVETHSSEASAFIEISIGMKNGQAIARASCKVIKILPRQIVTSSHSLYVKMAESQGKKATIFPFFFFYKKNTLQVCKVFFIVSFALSGRPASLNDPEQTAN